MKNGILIIISVLILLSPAFGAVELGEKYIDPVNGYSLCPPKGVTQSKSGASPLTTKWEMTDPQSKTVEYAILATRVKKQDASFTDLLARFKRQFTNTRPLKRSGRQGFEFSGKLTANKSQFFQKGIIYAIPGGDAVGLTITGSFAKRKHLEEVFDKVTATFEVSDPKKNIEQAKINLQKGEELLSFPPSRLEKLINTGRRFYLYTQDGKATGYMIVDENPSNAADYPGIQCKYQIRIDSASALVTIKREMVSSFNRTNETWAETLGIIAGTQTVNISQTGRRDDDSLEVEFVRNGKKSKNPPAKIPDMAYLPKAMELLVYRLIVDKPAQSQYAFAVYQETKNIFNMRTFSVIGPEQIKIGNENFDAVKLTDQLDINKAPAAVWVDKKGNILRIETDGGLVMEKTSQDTVKTHYPDAGKD